MTPNPDCKWCGEPHDPVRTKEDCDLTTARTIYGRWLIVEQQLGVARAALQVAEKELGELNILDEEAFLTDELGHFKAAFDQACSNLTVADAFTALIVRLTGQASERANAAVSRERALAMKRAEAEQSADACESCGETSGSFTTVGGGAGATFVVCAECARDDQESVAKNGGAS